MNTYLTFSFTALYRNLFRGNASGVVGGKESFLTNLSPIPSPIVPINPDFMPTLLKSL